MNGIIMSDDINQFSLYIQKPVNNKSYNFYYFCFCQRTGFKMDKETVKVCFVFLLFREELKSISVLTEFKL